MERPVSRLDRGFVLDSLGSGVRPFRLGGWETTGSAGVFDDESL